MASFKDFIFERQKKVFTIPPELKRLINPIIQTTNVPVWDNDFDYFKYRANLLKLEKELRGSESKIESGIVQDDNFYVFSFKALTTIPGSSTRHPIPFKLKDLKKQPSDRGFAVLDRMLSDMSEDDIKIKMKRRSRSGYFMTNDVKYLDIYKIPYFDNPFKAKTGFQYIVDNVYDIEDKIKIINYLNTGVETMPLYSFSFRKDTPDKVGDDYKAKVREYLDINNESYQVDPNTEFGPLMRTRTVTAGSISDNIRLLRKSTSHINHMQKFHPWQQGTLADKLHKAISIINMDVSNYDFSDTRVYRDFFVHKLGLDSYYKEFNEFPLLAWDYDPQYNIRHKLLKLVDLGNGTTSGHQLFTTNLNWIIPIVDISDALINNGWDEDRVFNWFLNPEPEGFELSSCGDDNSFIIFDSEKVEFCKNIAEWMVQNGSIHWSIEYGSTLGLLRNRSGEVSNDISKNFVKSLMTPYNFISKIKPYRAFGYKLKYSMSSYRYLLDKLFFYYPEMKSVIESAREPQLEGLRITLNDLEHLDWDPRSKLYDLTYADISSVEIKNML